MKSGDAVLDEFNVGSDLDDFDDDRHNKRKKNMVMRRMTSIKQLNSDPKSAEKAAILLDRALRPSWSDKPDVGMVYLLYLYE